MALKTFSREFMLRNIDRFSKAHRKLMSGGYVDYQTMMFLMANTPVPLRFKLQFQESEYEPFRVLSAWEQRSLFEEEGRQ